MCELGYLGKIANPTISQGKDILPSPLFSDAILPVFGSKPLEISKLS